jgi:hypothetical protein
VGQQVRAALVAKNASGGTLDLSPLPVAWKSSNTNIVSVSSRGMVTTVAPGTADVSATAAGYSASVTQ